MGNETEGLDTITPERSFPCPPLLSLAPFFCFFVFCCFPSQTKPKALNFFLSFSSPGAAEGLGVECPVGCPLGEGENLVPTSIR